MRGEASSAKISLNQGFLVDLIMSSCIDMQMKSALRIKPYLQVISILLAVVTIAGCCWIWEVYGLYGFNIILRRGGTCWLEMSRDDSRLSPSMQTALKDAKLIATSGILTWTEPEKGFEVAELPVIVDGKQVDTILLNRIDPSRYKFIVRNSHAGDKNIDEWEHFLPDAVLIVNGSYYDKKGFPDTPIISLGRAMGPQMYEAKAGAFIASAESAAIKDFTHEDWQQAFSGASNAMVSYPLLIGSDGQTHVLSTSEWLANRTFLAQDSHGLIIIGTTKEAFFSLKRLAEFLKASPLDLKIALNLDGGPVACQSVRLNGFGRKFYATWEAQVTKDRVMLLQSIINSAPWAMPMILEVERK